MTTMKTTKRALLSSVIALFLCFAMLVGTTYAWFTDSVTSAGNVITAGNLDVDVQYTLDGTNWDDLDGADDLFQKDLWEPGHTEVIALKITNKGSLALKYTANMNILNEKIGKTKDNKDIVLSEILTVSTLTFADSGVDPVFGINIAQKSIEEAFKGENGIAYDAPVSFKSGNVLESSEHLLPGAVQYVAIKVDMAETVGNEANHNGVDIPSIEFGINVLATQYSYEADSFGNDYDKDATYPVASVEDLEKALADGGNVVLINDLVVTDTMNVTKDTNLDLNGNKLTVSRLEAKAEVTINGGTLVNGEATYPAISVNDGGKLVLNDVEVIGGTPCNIVTSGTAQAAEIVGVQVFGGECVLNNCDITVEVTERRYSNSVFAIGIHDGSLTMNGGSITVNSAGSDKEKYDYQSAIFAGGNTEKTVTLNNVAFDSNSDAKFLYAWGGNITVNTTAPDGTYDASVDARNGGAYTINYVD